MAAVGSASGGKLYRFPPTRELHADYDAVVPAAIRGRKRARELEQYLRLRNEEEVAGREVEREYPVILPPVRTLTDDVGSGESSPEEPWPGRVEGSLLRKIATLRRALYMAGKEMRETEKGIKILIQSARESASATACVLSRHTPRAPRQEEVAPGLRVTCAESGCGKKALPYSRFCLHHMSSDHDQVLYGRCVGTEAGSGVCGHTVPDLLLNQPLCSKHITKAALETGNQQQQQKKKSAGGAARPGKNKGKSQKKKKTKAAATTATKLVVTESSPAVATTSAGVGVSSTSSWSSGESDGENPLVIDAKQTKVAKSVQLPEKGDGATAEDSQQLPPLTEEEEEATLDLSLTPSIPIPSLILPPPLPDIGKFMDDSSSEES